MEVLQRTANRGSISTGAYEIDNSVVTGFGSRFLYRTPSSAGNQKTWTLSFWIKRWQLGATNGNRIFEAWDGSTGTSVLFQANDTLTLDLNAGSNYFVTSGVFRDTAAWYHIVIRVDTTSGTDSERARVYVNGEEAVGSWTGGYIGQNTDLTWNKNARHDIGRFHNNDSFCQAYYSEIHNVDGASLAPTAFGEVDADSGIWKPKAASPTYGTNGFYLDFESSGSLGADSSGNSNDFTLNNITSADQATDTPTNNFCTLMPPQVSITGTATTVSVGGTQMTGGSTGSQNAFGSIGVRKGKWYFESNVSNLAGVDSYNFFFGVIAADKTTAISNGTANYIGQIANTWGFTSNNRGITGGTENPNFPSETATSGTTEVMGIALDMDNGKIWVHKAGTYATNNSSVTGNPATGAAPQYDNLLTSTDEHILVGGGVYTQTSAAQRNMNFGNPMSANFTDVGTHSDANGYGSFAYTPPSGYYALCTKNLAEYG